MKSIIHIKTEGDASKITISHCSMVISFNFVFKLFFAGLTGNPLFFKQFYIVIGLLKLSDWLEWKTFNLCLSYEKDKIQEHPMNCEHSVFGLSSVVFISLRTFYLFLTQSHRIL